MLAIQASWRHHTETLNAILTLCEWNQPIPDGFSSKWLMVLFVFSLTLSWKFGEKNYRVAEESRRYDACVTSMQLVLSAACELNAMCLTRWGRVTHICVSKLNIIGSDNGLPPGRRQAITWTNAGIQLIRTLGTDFSEILSEIHTFSFKKMHLKMSSTKRRQFCLSLNELNITRWYHGGTSRSIFNFSDHRFKKTGAINTPIFSI